eukprot:3132593-Pyramimonas_sp.AAC.1
MARTRKPQEPPKEHHDNSTIQWNGCGKFIEDTAITQPRLLRMGCGPNTSSRRNVSIAKVSDYAQVLPWK